MFKSQLQNSATQCIYFFSVFHPPFWRGFLSLYSQLNCILVLHLYSHWPSFGCLSHQDFAGGGKMCCKLWGYYSRVIPPLMRPTELVLCIELGCDDYFIWTFPFFFACTSILSSSVFCLSVQVAYSTLPEKRSLFKLLRESASSSFLLEFSSMCWARTDVWVGPSISSDWAHRPYSVLRSYPSHIYIRNYFYLE